MNDIAVIIVNWNAREDLRRCLHSLFDVPKPQVDCSVWVVDNASEDGSAAMVQAEFPEARLIVNADNLGFSKANNQAIAQADSRYVFLLNSDAVIHSGALEGAGRLCRRAPASRNHRPESLNPDGSLQFSCRRFPSLGGGIFPQHLSGAACFQTTNSPAIT